MARVTVEDCLKESSNRFALVHLVAKRAKQILKGAPILGSKSKKKKNKYVVSALREVAEGLVKFQVNEYEAQSKEIESSLKK